MALLIRVTRSNVSYQSKLMLKINKNNEMKGIWTYCLHTENNASSLTSHRISRFWKVVSLTCKLL